MVLYLHKDYNGDFSIDKKVNSEFFDFETLVSGIKGNSTMVAINEIAKRLGARKLVLDF